MVYTKELSGYLSRVASSIRRMRGKRAQGGEKSAGETPIVPIINLWIPTVYPFFWVERRDDDK